MLIYTPSCYSRLVSQEMCLFLRSMDLDQFATPPNMNTPQDIYHIYQGFDVGQGRLKPEDGRSEALHLST